MRAPAVLAFLAVAAAGAGGFAYWRSLEAAKLPPGLATVNGRIEVERVDIASKLAGRIALLRVKEGDFVNRGDVIARLDTSEIDAQLAAAKASAQRAFEQIGTAKANVAIREAEHTLSALELQRGEELEKRKALATAEVDKRRAQNQVAEAQILAARAAVRDAEAAKRAADAQVAQIEATIEDMTMRTPVTGRVEYRLVQVGEVVAAGGRIVTILDLTDVYMTIFLPTSQAGRVAYGSDARIVLDAAPNYVVPATVSFVAAEAQFTPKTVETADEREKLMYRVKLSVDPKLLETYRDYVRAGLTGNAYVKVDPNAPWPARLEPRLPQPPSEAAAEARTPAADGK